tara:strand:+ start:262 stop:1428 length:1167 start_codon:yes stop_codon:yes gene_type:complete
MASAGSSVLGVYNPIFYAQEALIHLESALGMASRVHRGFDAERRSYGKGDTINIRRPQTFTAQSAPVSSPDGLETDTVAVTLDQWKEVKFALTDKELAYTGNRIIEDHIRPASYALADNIDQALCANVNSTVGNSASTFSASDSASTTITKMRRKLFDAKAPMDDLHMQIDGEMEETFLKDSAFSQYQGAGDAGVNTQLRGTLGTKFGMEIFANQNADTMDKTAGTLADLAGAVDGTFAKGATAVTVDGLTNGETIKIGDSFTIAGDSTVYCVTADVTVGSGEASLSCSPPLQVAPSDGAVVTLVNVGASTSMGVAFHRNAFCIAMATLPEMGNELGAKVATVADPKTGLALRSRVYYKGDSSQVHVALDVLYGIKTLDPMLAVKMTS